MLEFNSYSSQYCLEAAIVCPHTLKPGPMLFVENADFVWAVMASMFIGNIILIIMNLPLVRLFALLLRIPYGLIYPAILIVCIVGAYAVATGLFEVGLMMIFGIAGYFMKKAEIPAAPMLMALLMGPMMERSLYQALNLSHGSVMVFIQRPSRRHCLGSSSSCPSTSASGPCGGKRRRRGGGGVATDGAGGAHGGTKGGGTKGTDDP